MFAKAEGPPRGMTALRASCFNHLVARAWGMGEILGPHNGRENDSLWPGYISQVNFGMALRRTRTENLALTMLARAMGSQQSGHSTSPPPRRTWTGTRGWLRRSLKLPMLPKVSGCGALGLCRANWPDRSHRDARPAAPQFPRTGAIRRASG